MQVSYTYDAWWAWETMIKSHNSEIPPSCGWTRGRDEKGHKVVNTERKCIHEPVHKMPSKDILWAKPRFPIKKQHTDLTDGGPEQPRQKGGWCSFEALGSCGLEKLLSGIAHNQLPLSQGLCSSHTLCAQRIWSGLSRIFLGANWEHAKPCGQPRHLFRILCLCLLSDYFYTRQSGVQQTAFVEF